MAANTALIEAAFKSELSAARADVPERKPLYRSTVEQTRQALGIVSGAIDEYNADMEKKEADKNKGIEKLQGMAAKVYKSIYEMEETLPDKVVTAVENEIMRMQEEYERIIELGGDDAQEGSRALSKIEAQYDKIKNEAFNLRQNLMLTTGAGKDNAWIMDEVHESNVDPLMSIFDFENIDDNDNVSVEFVNGKITFTTQNYSTGVRSLDPDVDESQLDSNVFRVAPGEEYKFGDPISFNSDQVREMLPSQSKEFEIYATNNLSNSEEFGKNDATNGTYNWDKDRENDERNGYIGQIKTKGDFQSAKSEIGVEGIDGLKKVLINSVDVQLAALENTFVDVDGRRLQGQELIDILNTDKTVDEEGNQVLDTSDGKGLKGEKKEYFKKVFDQLLDALTNIHNDAFNLDVSTGLLADYHIRFAKQHYDKGFKSVKGAIIPGEATEDDESLSSKIKAIK